MTSLAPARGPGRRRPTGGGCWPTGSTRFVPEEPAAPFARFADDSVGPSDAGSLAAAMPFDVVIGSCNPLAPPVELEFDPPKAIGRVVFTASYEGAPGCVHGAARPVSSTSC